jgi:hypothetical protein
MQQTPKKMAGNFPAARWTRVFRPAQLVIPLIIVRLVYQNYAQASSDLGTKRLRKFTLGKDRIEFTLGCSDIVSSKDSLVKLYTFPFGYASGSLSLPRQLAH